LFFLFSLFVNLLGTFTVNLDSGIGLHAARFSKILGQRVLVLVLLHHGAKVGLRIAKHPGKLGLRFLGLLQQIQDRPGVEFHLP
jgi:hypothetical protein